MPDFRVQRNGRADQVFNGKVVAQTRAYTDCAHPDSNASAGRWAQLTISQTASCIVICRCASLTQWEGVVDRSDTTVCPDEVTLVAFFDYGRLAKRLYETGGIDAARRAD